MNKGGNDGGGERGQFLKIEVSGLANRLDVGSRRRAEVKFWESLIYTLYSDEVIASIYLPMYYKHIM